MLDQDNNFYLVSLNTLITGFLDFVWIYHRQKLHFNQLWEFRVKEKGIVNFDLKINEA